MILCYWRCVLANAFTWGFHWAAGGLERFVRATAITIVTLALVYIAGGATKAGEQLDAVFLGHMALAITCALFIVLGLIVVPPQLDKLIREEKKAEVAEKEALAVQIEARGSTKDLFSTLCDQWDLGQEVYESRGGSRKHGRWRDAVWAWHARAIAALSDVKENVASQSLQEWKNHEALKQTGNPEQSLVVQLNESLKVLARERDRLSRVIAEESSLDVSTKDDAPSV